METKGKKPSFCGLGLSYGKVVYSPVALSSDTLTKDGQITAAVTVENKGSLPVKEAVQLYIRDIKGSVVRPLREMKGLEKITLQPGENKEVRFTITEELLRFYDADMNFVSESGDFTLWIGHDSLTENGADFRLV